MCVDQESVAGHRPRHRLTSGSHMQLLFVLLLLSTDDVSGLQSHRQTDAEDFLRSGVSSESKTSLRGVLHQLRNQIKTAVKYC